MSTRKALIALESAVEHYDHHICTIVQDAKQKSDVQPSSSLAFKVAQGVLQVYYDAVECSDDWMNITLQHKGESAFLSCPVNQTKISEKYAPKAMALLGQVLYSAKAVLDTTAILPLYKDVCVNAVMKKYHGIPVYDNSRSYSQELRPLLEDLFDTYSGAVNKKRKRNRGHELRSEETRFLGNILLTLGVLAGAVAGASAALPLCGIGGAAHLINRINQNRHFDNEAKRYRQLHARVMKQLGGEQ